MDSATRKNDHTASLILDEMRKLNDEAAEITVEHFAGSVSASRMGAAVEAWTIMRCTYATYVALGNVPDLFLIDAIKDARNQITKDRLGRCRLEIKEG
jgi:hypothetical protein